MATGSIRESPGRVHPKPGSTQATIEAATPRPEQPTWDCAPAMPAIEPNAPPPAPEPDGDPDVRVLIFGSNRLSEGLNRRTKTTIIADLTIVSRLLATSCRGESR
jgi:hypothetical protein